MGKRVRSYIVAGEWDCRACGTTNDGGLSKCPQCGSPRGKTPVTLPRNARVVTDTQELDRARSGPDWHCPRCGTANPNRQPRCSNCGAPNPANQPATSTTANPRPSQPPRRAASPSASATSSPAASSYRPPHTAPRNYGRPAMKGNSITIAAIVAVLLLAAIFVFAPRTKTVSVVGYSWEIAVRVEQQETRTDSAWESEVPYDAVRISWVTKQNGTEKIPCGTETINTQVCKTVVVDTIRGTQSQYLGNGYYEIIETEEDVYGEDCTYVPTTVTKLCEQPKYEDWVTYRTTRWYYARTEKAQGTDHRTYPPTVNLRSNEREGSTNESYTAFLRTAEGKQYRYTTSKFANWAHLDLGAKVDAQVNLLGMVYGLQ